MMLVAGIAAVSCKKDEIGGTATESMAGEWHVTADLLDASGEVAYTDPYGIGKFILSTFNTASNVPDRMFVSDNGHFWEFQVEVGIDQTAMSFSTDGMSPNLAYESNVEITGGRILPGAATTPSGMPADSIVFNVAFDDDDPSYVYRISGYRYSGFAADN